MSTSLALSRNHINCNTSTNSANNNTYCVANYCPQNHYINSNEIAITTLNCSDIGIDVNSYGNNVSNNHPMVSSSYVPSISSNTPIISNTITIPFGWRRESIEDRIVYFSPSNHLLSSLNEIANYLQSEGTCKCGLECPLIIRKSFSFDPKIQSKAYNIEEAKHNNENKLCNHKRKIIALAEYKQHSSQTAILIAEQHKQQLNRAQLIPNQEQEKQDHSDNQFYEQEFSYSLQTPHIQSADNLCAQQSERIRISNVGNHNSSHVTVSKFSNEKTRDSVSVIQTNENIDKLPSNVIENGGNSSSNTNNPNIVSSGLNRFNSNDTQTCIIGSQPQFVQTNNNCETHCHYSVPIQAQNANTVRNSETHAMALQLRPTGAEHMGQSANSFCLYDNNGNSAGVYSFSSCDTQLSVQQNNNKTSIYLTPQNSGNYQQMISYDSTNVNLIQPSHSQTYTPDSYSHHYNHSDSGCNHSVQTTITNIQSYIPIQSGSHALSPPNSANPSAIAFNANPLSSTAINLNPTYPHSSHDHSQHHSQNNISILPQNPPMPPLSVPNVTTVTSSVTDVIPAVGVAPQIIHSGNASGGPQVLQFINSVPLTQLSANTVTVLQQTPTQEVQNTMNATLLIPQLMPSHEHPVVINHPMAHQTAAMFPHIATATSLTALPNAFQNAIGIANAISLPQRSCISDTGKPFTRTRKRKEYNRTNRSHPPTVASILKQAADNEKKQKELINQEKQQKQLTVQSTVSQTNESDCTVDSSQRESNRSVAVQSELQSDTENLVNSVCSDSNADTIQSDNECNVPYNSVSLTGDKNIPVLQDIQIGSNNEEIPNSDISSEHLSPISECFNGSDSGVESEPIGANICTNCEEPDSQQVVDTTRQRSLKRLKRLRKELSIYYENDSSDDESPQSPPLPPQPRTFNAGDLVWGQMGDVRFWPGKLVCDDELIGLAIDNQEGKLIVRWFGYHTLSQVEPANLKTLSEGLEEHHCARKRHRSGKRMNSFLEQAIQEAMAELDRQTNQISLTSADTVLGVVTSTQTLDN